MMPLKRETHPLPTQELAQTTESWCSAPEALDKSGYDHFQDLHTLNNSFPDRHKQVRGAP